MDYPIHGIIHGVKHVPNNTGMNLTDPNLGLILTSVLACSRLFVSEGLKKRVGDEWHLVLKILDVTATFPFFIS